VDDAVTKLPLGYQPRHAQPADAPVADAQIIQLPTRGSALTSHANRQPDELFRGGAPMTTHTPNAGTFRDKATTVAGTARDKATVAASTARAKVTLLATGAKDRLPSAAAVKDNTYSVAQAATDTKAKRYGLAGALAAVVLVVVGLRRRNSKRRR
jgi:hypothetical protein